MEPWRPRPGDLPRARLALEAAWGRVQAELPGAFAVAASLCPPLLDPEAPGGRLGLWYSPSLESMLGLRPWVDGLEGHCALPGGGAILWQAVELERGLREALRQSLSGLEFWCGYPLEHLPGWPARCLPRALTGQLRALAPGAAHGGMLATLEAAALGLRDAGAPEGALRLARLGLAWGRQGALCGSQEGLARRCPEEWEAALEALAQERARDRPGGAPSYAALGDWLVRARLACRAETPR